MTEPSASINGDQLRLDAYLVAVWRAKWLILTATIAAAAVAAVGGLRQPTLHTSSALVEVGRVWKEPLEDPYATREVANSAVVLGEAAARISARPGDLKRAVRAEAVEVGPRRERYPILVRITATSENSADAVRFAQAVADEVVARHEKIFEQSLRPYLESQRRLEQRLKEVSTEPGSRDLALKLESELDQVKANNTSPTITRKTTLVEPAEPGPSVAPAIRRRVAAAAFIAALISIAVAALLGHAGVVKQGQN
jgi:hypothetical protein